MAIFQTSVLKKFLNQQDKVAVEKAYKKFTKYFHDPTIQQNIRDSKEEQFQAKFLDELFVNIFGYTLSPQPNFNLTTEFKNVKNSRKADGAILLDDKALAVIELKSTKTKDLESIRQQAFDYKANQPGCIYVITSNFEKVRFYINNAVDHEEFDLFTLSLDRFELMYLCLHQGNLLKNVPLKIKESSILEEEAITKKFYADYSLFKRELYRDLVKQNMRNDVFRNVLSGEVSISSADKNIKLTLFKKSQKLLDRFLFLFFGEDRGLLPPNSIPQILEQWEKLKELDEYTPLYDRYKKYFNYLNEGWKGKDYEIFAYNGGLFKPDPILDSIKVDDDLLYKHTSILTKYDFESQVDVNILGHIFENSLNEIESVNAEIEGVEFDKQKTKRKKDGVFYTPKYITKYIVDNTIGKLCEEKKVELGVIEDEYLKGRKNRPKATVVKLDEQLNTYRDWLLEITICDPACGSGAFLNQALEFLIAEHRWIDEMQAKLLGGAIVFQDVENSILENNIYGVDLNEESVEIAKLSLWLRTAQVGRKLTSLNNNIKCGNSLIDSKSVAGDKAFNWEKEFSEVFANGGFDVVIGNPPYVRQELIDSNTKNWLASNYECGNGTADLYVYFYEKGLKSINENGLLGFITPNKFYKTKYGKELRSFLTKKHILEMVDFFELRVFQDASTDSQILFIKNTTPIEIDNIVYSPIRSINEFADNIYRKILVERNSLNEEEWVFVDQKSNSLLKKISSNSVTIQEFTNNGVEYGIKTGYNQAFIISKEVKDEIINKDPKSHELIHPYIAPTNIKKWHLENKEELFFINTGYDLDVNKYPGIKGWLDGHLDRLSKRSDKGMTPYNLRACSYYQKFESPKIVYIRTAVKHCFYLDSDGYYVNDSCYIISDANYTLSAILNSRVFQFYKKLKFVAYGDAHEKGRVKLDYNKMIKFPIPTTSSTEQQKTEQLVRTIRDYSEKLNELKESFLKYLSATKVIKRTTKKLDKWYQLEPDAFLGELNKEAKKNGGLKLNKADEMEWMNLFEVKKKDAQKLNTEIEKMEMELNQEVYRLYGLSEEEIEIVEGS